MHTHTHTQTVDGAISVGPVGRAAVARLVDLALLLQAAGLAALTWTTLNVRRDMFKTPVKMLQIYFF